jgi:hypothetical protein
MSERGKTPVLKIVLGILAGLLVATLAVAGGCVVLMGACTAGMVKSQRDLGEYRGKVAVQVDTMEPHPSGVVFVRGTVTNNGTQRLGGWRVWLSFRDKNGREVTGNATSSSRILEPGKSERFEYRHALGPIGEHEPYARVEATVIDVSFPTAKQELEAARPSP